MKPQAGRSGRPKRRLWWLIPAWVMLAAAHPAAAQSEPAGLVFSYRSLADTSGTTIVSGGTIVFSATRVGNSSQAILSILNRGLLARRVTGIVTDDNGFSAPGTPLDLAPGGVGQVTVTFAPRQNGPHNGLLTIRDTAGTVYTFQLSGSGVAPLMVSSVLFAGGNQTALNDGARIEFPNTQVGETTSASLIVANRGTGAGSITGVTVSGAGFAVSGVPLLPLELGPGGEIKFTLSFAPTVSGAVEASIRVVTDSVARTFLLRGQGTAAALAVEWVSGSGGGAVASNGVVQFPGAGVGSASSLTFLVRNGGNAAARIAALTATGAEFQIVEAPVLPVTLPPGGTLTLRVSFKASAPGTARGRLAIDNFVVNLEGTGVGPRMAVEIDVEGVLTVLSNNSVALFPNTAVGNRTTAAIRVSNTGNMPLAVSSANISGEAFRLEGIPALPARVQPGEQVVMSVRFSPTVTGINSGTLQVEDLSVTLRGTGMAPAALSGYAFSVASASLEPLQQPAVGLTLDAPYPLDITGTLTLTVAPQSFIDDPTIQFATGGRTIGFRIPANTREAIFSNSTRQIQFQSGSVAGTITLTPSFSLGAVDLTPRPAPAQAFTVPAGPVVLRNARIGARTANSFEVIVTGYATTRSVTELTFRFAAASGGSLQTTVLTANVEGVFVGWYQSSSSMALGSQFTASAVITATQGELSAVGSVGVTAANALGKSAEVTAALQ